MHLDWSGWLEVDDAIVTSSWHWASEVGLTLTDSVLVGMVAYVTIHGGTVGAGYLLQCHVDTERGRTMEKTIQVWVQ